MFASKLNAAPGGKTPPNAGRLESSRGGAGGGRAERQSSPEEKAAAAAAAARERQREEAEQRLEDENKKLKEGTEEWQERIRVLEEELGKERAEGQKIKQKNKSLMQF